MEKEVFDSKITLESLQENEIDFDELLTFTETYLENPSSVWKEAKIDKKQKLQWFQFPQGVVFQNGNYGTTEIANVFKTKEAFLPLQSHVVDVSGEISNSLKDYLSRFWTYYQSNTNLQKLLLNN